MLRCTALFFLAQNLKTLQVLRFVMKKIKFEKQEKYLPSYKGKVFSKGNKKLGEDTLIANLTSAEHCPAKELGLCRVEHYCYAKKCERIYPNYKRKNLIVEDWIGSASADEIYDLLEAYIDDYEDKKA